MADNPNLDLDQQRSQWQEDIRSVDPNAPAAATQQPERFSINIGGRSYDYPDKAAAEAALTNWVTNQSAEMAKWKAEAEAAQRVQQQLAQPSSPASRAAYSHDEYLKMLATDSKAAQNYADQHRLFGSYDPGVDVGQMLLTTMQQNLETSREITKLKLQRDNPHINFADPQVADMLEKARAHYGKQQTYDGLTDTIGRLTAAGHLKSRSQWQNEAIAASQPNPQNNLREFPRPSGIPSTGNASAYQMGGSDEQQARAFMTEFDAYMADERIPWATREARMNSLRDGFRTQLKKIS